MTLPLVVLVSFMAQPRLLFAMAKDGLLPHLFAEVSLVISCVYANYILCVRMWICEYVFFCVWVLEYAFCCVRL